LNWTDTATFAVTSVQNDIDQGLFTNCKIQYSATSSSGDPLDADYVKLLGGEYIEVSVSDDDIAGVSVENIHDPNCINHHHPSCETKMSYTIALNEARPGYHEDERPFSTSWMEHWSGGLIKTTHTYLESVASVGGFLIKTTTEDGVVTNITNVTDPNYEVFYAFVGNATVNSTVTNGTAQTPPQTLHSKSSTWYTYEDRTCAPMDSFDVPINGRLSRSTRSGHDIANLSVVTTVDDCAAACLANDACRSFDFSATETFCALGSGRVVTSRAI